jgi:hypothetical protein
MALTVSAPVVAQANELSQDVAVCLQQARSALRSGPPQSLQIDAYAATGQIFFHNPFVSQDPTFAFWKCLRLKGYDIPG